MHILGKILAFETMEEEFYFLQLEALWLLVNLAACDESDDCQLLLLSEYPPMEPIQPGQHLMSALETYEDFVKGSSEILSKVEQVLKLALNCEGPE